MGDCENMTVATWRSGPCVFRADAQKVADEISSIGLTVRPEEIVDKARDENTELHKCFEWDDTKAAEKYRVYQARQIVCHLIVKEVNDEPQKQEVRFFYKTDSQEGYKPTSYIMRNEDEYQKLLDRAFSELKAFEKKYSTLKELGGLFDVINTLTA